MKVLLIEDEIKAADSITRGLTEHDIEVDFALDAEKGHILAQAGTYDVIVTDIIVPGMSGLEFTRLLREEGNQTPVLVLTALGSTDDKVAGLESGADDYLTKPFAFRELLARIKALSRRGKDHQQVGQVLSYKGIEMDLSARSLTRDGIPIELTPREFALMEFFMREQGRIISKKEISEKVWNIHFESTSNVVEVYVNYLRNKVDKPFPRKAIHTLFAKGYKFELE